MTYNLELLRRERDWVAQQRALPESESQLLMDYWYCDNKFTISEYGKSCDTTYCVAGHIAATTLGVTWSGGSYIEVNGVRRDIAGWATEQLGLTPLQASDLFYAPDDCVLDELDELIALAENEAGTE